MECRNAEWDTQAVGDVWEIDSLGSNHTRIDHHIPPEEAVGSVEPMDYFPMPPDVSSPGLTKGTPALLTDEGLALPMFLLYRDERVLRDMHSRLNPELLLDTAVQQRLRLMIQACPDCFTHGWSDLAHDLVLRPKVEWVLSATAENESELTWSIASHHDVNNIILMLLLTVTAREVGEVRHSIQVQLSQGGIEHPVYPGMVIKLRGVLRGDKDVSPHVMYLWNRRLKAQVNLESTHELEERYSLMHQRRVFVLGIVEQIEQLIVRAGAVLVGEASDFRHNQN